MGTHPFIRLALAGDPLGCTEGDPLGLLAPFESMLSCGPAYLFQELFTDATNDTNFTNTRATTQYVETDTGNLFPVPAGAIPIKGARPVRNLARSGNDLTAWTGASGTLNSTISGVDEVTFDGTDGAYLQFQATVSNPTTTQFFVVSAEIKTGTLSPSAAADLLFVIRGNAITNATKEIGAVVTGDYQRFSVVSTGDGAGSDVVLSVGSSLPGTVHLRNLQIQEITHRAALSTAPDEFIDPDTDYGTGVNGFRYFTTALANTVDGSGVVTEGTGAALTGIALANVPGATNVCIRSSDLTTWSKRNAISVAVVGSGSDQYSMVSNLTGANADDLFITVSGLTADARYEPSCVMRRTTTTGTVVLQAPAGAGFGQWYIDLSLIGTSFERITRTHSAVTVNNEFVATSGGAGGLYFYRQSSGDPAQAFDVKLCQLELGVVSTAPIYTSGSTASTDAAVLDFSGVTGFVTPNETRIVCTGLGPNLVADPGFDDDGYWTNTAIISGGELLVDQAASEHYALRDGVVAEGQTFLYAFDVVSTVGVGAARARIGGTGYGSNKSTVGTQVGVITVSGTSPTRVQIEGISGFIGVLDNFRVHKIDPTRDVETIIDVDNWDGTDLSDILPHANVISVTQYAPGERP